MSDNVIHVDFGNGDDVPVDVRHLEDVDIENMIDVIDGVVFVSVHLPETGRDAAATMTPIQAARLGAALIKAAREAAK
jgi:type III secretory pathway lipoprotein EscJ